jgi:Fe-S-cluster-containing dehydrogenase component
VQQSYVKAQCMHCVDPACAAACMLGALQKDELTGIVTYDVKYCVGCRYCMMACPYNVPKFEYEKAVPQIVKCEFCRHRVGGAEMASVNGFSRFPVGHGPACCEVCPRDAVVYGTREELLAEARRRLEEYPDRYLPRIYGETEAGGTQVLYISHVPFQALGLPDFGDRGVPHVAYTIQEGLYQGFIAPVALYGVLGLVMWRNRKTRASERPGSGQEGAAS